MRELNNEIAVLELRSEQILIHLQRLQRDSPEAIVARADLDAHVHRLVAKKCERDRLLLLGAYMFERRRRCGSWSRRSKKRTRERHWGETRALALR